MVVFLSIIFQALSDTVRDGNVERAAFVEECLHFDGCDGRITYHGKQD